MSVEPPTFLDTNVLVYAVDRDAGAKRGIAGKLVERGFEDGCYTVSTQVMKELFSVVRSKLRDQYGESEAAAYVLSFRAWPVVESTRQLVEEAIDRSRRHGISIWDAAILAACRAGGCRKLLSEDLTDGRDYDGVVVENPFREVDQR